MNCTGRNLNTTAWHTLSMFSLLPPRTDWSSKPHPVLYPGKIQAQWQFARFAGWERKEVRRAAFRGLAIGTSTQLFICQKFVKSHRMRSASDCAHSASFFTCNFLTL
jgi:hypothetical protein